MQAKSWQQFILKALAVFAYLSCLFAWVLVVLPFIPGVLDSEALQTFVSSGGAAHPAVDTPPQQLPEWLMITIVAIITCVVLIVTAVTLVRLPRAVGKSGQKLTRSVAERVVPVVTHHAKIPQKKRLALTARVVFDIKLALLALPVFILLVIPLPEIVISRQMLLLVAALSAGWSLLLFCLEVILARAFRVPLDRLW